MILFRLEPTDGDDARAGTVPQLFDRRRGGKLGRRFLDRIVDHGDRVAPQPRQTRQIVGGQWRHDHARIGARIQPPDRVAQEKFAERAISRKMLRHHGVVAEHEPRLASAQDAGNHRDRRHRPHEGLDRVRLFGAQIAHQRPHQVAQARRVQREQAHLRRQQREQLSIIAHNEQIDLVTLADEMIDQRQCDPLGTAKAKGRNQKRDTGHARQWHWPLPYPSPQRARPR